MAELAAAGKPSLLIPFAAAADDHQRSNAEVMVKAGAAVMIQEQELARPEILAETLSGLLADQPRLRSMAQQARNQARPGAAERIAQTLANLARR